MVPRSCGKSHLVELRVDPELKNLFRLASLLLPLPVAGTVRVRLVSLSICPGDFGSRHLPALLRYCAVLSYSSPPLLRV
jgi:hypothetical protein